MLIVQIAPFYFLLLYTIYIVRAQGARVIQKIVHMLIIFEKFLHAVPQVTSV